MVTFFDGFVLKKCRTLLVLFVGHTLCIKFSVLRANVLTTLGSQLGIVVPTLLGLV